MDIKDKYATLRIYGFFGEEIRTIIKEATKECSETCESCGSKDGVKTTGKGSGKLPLVKKKRDSP